MKSKSVLSTFASILFFCLIFVQVAAAEETYVFVDEWGSNGIGDGQFNRPGGVAVDSVGNVYVTDLWNDRVQKFSTDGAFLMKWGSNGIGDGQFKDPIDITVDSAGNVFVSDYNQIQKFTSNGTFLKKWGSLGTRSGQFNQTQGVAVDSAGNVYVADCDNNRIQKFTSDGIFLKMWGSYGTGNGQFNSPVGVAVDSANNVYVTEYGNSRIQKFTSQGIFLKTWGSYGTGTGQFYNPKGVSVDSAGNVYVIENGNCRVQKFTSDGIFVTKWGSQGSGNGQLKNPTDIDVDSVGNIYITDYINHRIQKFALIQTTNTPSRKPPTADFSASSASGLAPLEIQFKDLSKGNPTSWNWDIDGDGLTDYTTKDIQHTFTAEGTYTVSLTVSNTYGSNTKTAIITVQAPPRITSAIWTFPDNTNLRMIHATEGYSVALVSTVENTQVKNINYCIYEKDFGFDDDLIGCYSADIINGKAILTWNAIWTQDGFVGEMGDPEYIFKVHLYEGGNDYYQWSDELQVHKKQNTIYYDKVPIAFDPTYNSLADSYPDTDGVISINVDNGNFFKRLLGNNDIEAGTDFTITVTILPKSVDGGNLKWIFFTETCEPYSNECTGDFENVKFLMNKEGFLIDPSKTGGNLDSVEVINKGNLFTIENVELATTVGQLAISTLYTGAPDAGSAYNLLWSALGYATETPTNPKDITLKLADNMKPLYGEVSAIKLQQIFVQEGLPPYPVIVYNMNVANPSTSALVYRFNMKAPDTPGKYIFTFGCTYNILNHNGIPSYNVPVGGYFTHLDYQLQFWSEFETLSFEQKEVIVNQEIEVK